VYSVGVETVMTGVQPAPDKTMFYGYIAGYAANEFVNGQGASSTPEFKLRLFANAVKIAHNWGVPFLGGKLESKLSLPLIYEQLHVASGKGSKAALGDISFAPIAVTYHVGNLHWYYEADLYGPGSPYSKNDLVNIGQHNLAIAASSGITWLPNRADNEVSSRFAYIINGPNHATGYHSGNEFAWEYNLDHSISKKLAVGMNGYWYRQTTDDTEDGALYQGGFRSRDLAIGPQVRYMFGPHVGLAFKYYRDTS
jgi:hypothetical protein